MGDDLNNSSLNNLFGHFLNVEAEDNVTYDFDNVNNMICIDTSNHRIGINTLDPTCSLDISGENGKINVNTILCETLDVSGINVYNKFLLLDSSINIIISSGSGSASGSGTINLQNGLDASFQNVDISGTLKVNDISVATLNTTDLSNYTLTSELQSGNLDLSFNNVDISGTLKVNDISVATLNTTNLSNYTLTSELQTGNLDLSFNNVDISGNLDVSGINIYEKISQLDTSINNNLIANNLNASFSNIDISGTLDLSLNRGRLNIVHIDNSGDLYPGELYYDLSGFVKIKLSETGKII
jgi:hypothetical protein